MAGESLWMLEGYTEQLVISHPEAFNSRQLAAIRFWCSPAVVSGETHFRMDAPAMVHVMENVVPDKSLDRKNVPLFPVVTGPMLTDVKWFVGKGSVKESYPYGTVFFDIMTQSTGQLVSEVVPIEVQRSWQNFYFKPVAAALLDVDYYQEHSLNYSAWSFEVHSKQVAKVVTAIPRHYRLVAPGDGWGVVKKVAPHRVYSTDIVKGIDATEPFSVTFEKLQPGDVLVLSYLWSLLSVSDQQQVLSWDGPVVVIDSQPRIMGFSTDGEGLFSKNCDDWFLHTITPEGYHEQTILFSENLLRIAVVSPKVQTSAYLYLITHRPLISRSVDGAVVCSNLAEAVRVKGECDPYLAPIGKVWRETVPTSCEMGVRWQTRKVYSLPLESPYIKTIEKYSYWTKRGDLFLFCFSFPTHIRFAKTTLTHFQQFSIKVSEDGEGFKEYPYLTEVTPDAFVWKFADGNKIWRRTPVSCALLWNIMHEHHGRSHRGWRRATGVISEPVLDAIDQKVYDMLQKKPVEEMMKMPWLEHQSVRVHWSRKSFQFDYRDLVSNCLGVFTGVHIASRMKIMIGNARVPWVQFFDDQIFASISLLDIFYSTQKTSEWKFVHNEDYQVCVF